MKNHQMFKSVAVIAVIFAAFILMAGLMISCGDESSKSSEAKLAGITIGEKTPSKIPTPISRKNWNDESFYFSDDEYTETLYFKNSEEITGIQIKATISSGAKVAFGLDYGYNRPDTFNSNSTLDITNGQALYVRVTAEDGKTVNYYRFSILTLSNNSQLGSLTVGEKIAELGRPSSSQQGVTVMGLLGLSKSECTDAKLVGTPINSAARIEYKVTKKTGDAGNFSANDTYTFEDGDLLTVRVTAENETVSYYKIEIEIGRDATLLSVKIGEATEDTLGTPRTEWGNGNWGNINSTLRGTCQAVGKMPAEGFTVEILPTDDEATVVWAITAPRGHTNASVTYPEPTDYGNESPIVFPGGATDIIIKVTSSNEENINWYQVRFISKSYATIYYGTPTLGADGYIDNSTWDSVDWLDVSRLNTAETYNAWFGTDEGRHTSARAKVLWDNDGLWSYWDITFKSPYTDNQGEKIRTASLSGDNTTYTAGTDVTVTTNSVPSDAHTNDSVEFFVNERLQKYQTGNYGNQYRSGLPNADGTIWLSGEKGNPPTTPQYFNPITQFQIDKKVNAWVKSDGSGYVIVMRVPWVKGYDTTEIDSVFDSSGNVKEGAEIGLELQVNACAKAGGRNGILTWNGVTSQAYQNVKSFGIVTLKITKEGE
jgi:hypothetical protein